MTYQVENFTYNGFSGQSKKVITKYTATFNSWTNDPGIMLCNCSDGEQRLIPTFALINYSQENHPIQSKDNNVLFGQSSHS